MNDALTALLVTAAAAAVIGLVWRSHKAALSAPGRGRADGGGGDGAGIHYSRNHDNDGGDGGDGGGD